MITTLPDPEIVKHIEPQGSPFRFVWEILFKNRKKLKLTQEDRDELESADAQTEPWRKIASYLHTARGNPEGFMEEAVNQALLNPTLSNAERIVAFTWTPPYHAMQISRAIGVFEGKCAEVALALIPPIVRRHLTRISGALESEISAQVSADEKALSRLDGAGIGGESAAVSVLRQRAEEVRRQLAGSDSHLCEWRVILAPYLT
jgi:hypothetical protein